MAKKGELSKTARASLGQRDDTNFMTGRVCEKCGEPKDVAAWPSGDRKPERPAASSRQVPVIS